MARPKKRSSSGPVSVILPEAVRTQVKLEALRRGLGLSTTVRVLVTERLQDSADAADLSRAEEWQRAQAWASWERLRDGEVEAVPRSAIDAVFARASRRGKRPAAARRSRT